MMMVISQNFLVRLFCVPSYAAPGGNCRLCPPPRLIYTIREIRDVVEF